MNLLKKCVAEMIGTMGLTFIACGVAVACGNSSIGTLGYWVSTALAFGFVVIAMAYSIGNVSGCHINPAVSLAMLLSKRMSLKEFFAYVGAQLIGALIGSVFLALCLRGDFTILGGNQIQGVLLTDDGKLDAWSYFGAFLVELLLTFVFVLAVLGATDKKYHDGKHAGIVIGLTLTLVHLLGLGFTGTSVNPARSFAPAVLQAIAAGATTSLKQIWIWILAPLAGAALAACVYHLLIKAKDSRSETKEEM